MHPYAVNSLKWYHSDTLIGHVGDKHMPTTVCPGSPTCLFLLLRHLWSSSVWFQASSCFLLCRKHSTMQKIVMVHTQVQKAWVPACSTLFCHSICWMLVPCSIRCRIITSRHTQGHSDTEKPLTVSNQFLLCFSHLSIHSLSHSLLHLPSRAHTNSCSYPGHFASCAPYT